MAAEMSVIAVRAPDDDDDESLHEGDPFLDAKDPKGKGKVRRVTIEEEAIFDAKDLKGKSKMRRVTIDPIVRAELSEKEAQERLDAALAISLYEQTMDEYRRYKRRQAAGRIEATSSLSGGADAVTPEQELLAPYGVADGLLRLYGVLPHSHTAVLVLLPSCAAELMLICLAPVLAAIFFDPMDKALYVWILMGNVVKCVLGMYIGVLCVLLQTTHLPRRVPIKAAGIPCQGRLFQLLRNFDLAIVMYFTFMLASACLDLLGLLLSVWSWHTHGTDDVRHRLTFVLIVNCCCAFLLAVQCFAVSPLSTILRSWPTQYRRHCNPNSLPHVYTPPASDTAGADPPCAPTPSAS